MKRTTTVAIALLVFNIDESWAWSGSLRCQTLGFPTYITCRGCGRSLQMAAGGRGSGNSDSQKSAGGRGVGKIAGSTGKKRDTDMKKAVRTWQVMEERKGKKKERKQVRDVCDDTR